MSMPSASMMPERASEGFERYPAPLRDRGRAAASFRLINQTVMTRAEAPTIDSWVHLAQTRRTPIWATLFFALAALGAAYAAVFAGLQLFHVVPYAGDGTSMGGLVLGMIAMTMIALACGWIASLMIGRRVRNGTVGARPSGVGLGESGVIVGVPGRDAEIPWTEIRGVTPSQPAHSATDSGKRDSALYVITLLRDPEAPAGERVQMLGAEGYVGSAVGLLESKTASI